MHRVYDSTGPVTVVTGNGHFRNVEGSRGRAARLSAEKVALAMGLRTAVA